MRIYLAARYPRRSEMLGYAMQLEELGHTVTARWIKGSHLISDDELNSGETYRMLGERYALEDLADVGSADILICFTDEPRTAVSSSRGGRHVELGVALMAGKGVWLVGPIENAFHCLSSIRRFDSWDDALRALEEERIEWSR